MKQLDISYNIWKNLVETNNWATYHIMRAPQICEIFSGTIDLQIRSSVRRDAYDVWENDFPSSIAKEDVDDVITSIIQEQYNDFRTSAHVYKDGETAQAADKHYLMGGKDGSNIYRPLTVDTSGLMLSNANIVQKKEYEIRLTDWDSSIELDNYGWTTVYENSNVDAVFYGAIFQVNSDNIKMKAIINGTNALEITLGDLDSNYKIGNGHGRDRLNWPVKSYFNKRWCFEPHVMLITSSIQIQFQSVAGIKRIENGMSWWGVK